MGSSGGVALELLYSAKLEEAPRAVRTPELAPAGVKSAPPKYVEWKNEGLTIEGLLYLPDDAAAKKVPRVVAFFEMEFAGAK